MSDRTYKVGSPLMKGSDIKSWQQELVRLFKKMAIKAPVDADGVYGVSTRSFTAALAHANGLNATKLLANGVTPEVRTLLRGAPGTLTAAQRKTRDSKARQEYRAKLRTQYARAGGSSVHTPVTVIVQDSWGYHPGVHDGLDVITGPDPVIFAMIRSKVIDVRASGWWGLGAPRDPKVKAKGDGIIQLEVLESIGPFKKGMHLGYGHAEKALVRLGDTVRAGQAIGHAGFANAWHIHLMVNDGHTSKGVGTQDPRPLLDYAVKHTP